MSRTLHFPGKSTPMCCARRMLTPSSKASTLPVRKKPLACSESSRRPIWPPTASDTSPCVAQVSTVGPMIVPPRYALARGRVRHVGDPVALVVAASCEAARDAAERIIVEYRPLAAVVEGPAALQLGAP